MPFTVEDLNDLLALLEKHPEWKERLRQVLLTEDLLRLPSAVNRLITSVDRLTEAVERLNQWQQQTNEQIKRLFEWHQQTVEWQLETIRWQQKADEWFNRIGRHLAELKEFDRERYYILRAPAVFGIFVRKGRDPRNEVMERLHDAVKKGIITRNELKALRDADHLWLGEYDGREVLLVVEVSYTVSQEDLVRAVQRAKIARRIGYNAVPIAAGSEVPDEIWEQARNFNVIVMSDGEADFEFAEQIIRQAVGLEN